MVNGSFNRRVSPTSFYALQTGVPADERVAAMMTGWLLNASHFCISPEGDHSGNADDCWWGLPSIEASDPAYPPLGYWRGYVWGPMAQLTYWGLQQYDHVPAAKTGRQALVKQMNSLFVTKWREARLICENYYPHKVHESCSPGAMHMYSAWRPRGAPRLCQAPSHPPRAQAGGPSQASSPSSRQATTKRGARASPRSGKTTQME